MTFKLKSNLISYLIHFYHE